MTPNTLIKLAAITLLGVSAPLAAQATAITLGGPLPTFRTATLDSATSGFTGSGNATVTDVTTYLPALAPWTERGSVAGGAGGPGTYVDGLLTVELLTGNWGSDPTSGTWTINDSAYWSTYGDAAISLHVGNGGGEPDHFVWLIEQGQLTGTWSADGTGLGGGGLSNLKLYSSGTGTTVPDAGSTLALLALTAAGLSVLRRKVG